MNELLNEEYYHLGTNKLYKELWLYPQMDQIFKEYIKPYGGLWTSHQNEYNLCDWIEYIEDNENKDKINNMKELDSSLIKFKETAKLLIIENNNDYKNLKDSGFVKILDKPIEKNNWYKTEIITELINYEKISDFYDLLYINNYAYKTLSNFSFRTMYALNPNSIEYYKSLEVNFENHEIINIGEKQYIKEPNSHYYNFIKYVETLFNEYDEEEYDIYIKKLKKEADMIIKNLFNNTSFDLEKINIKNKYRLISTVIRNIYRNKYLKKQKTLEKK